MAENSDTKVVVTPLGARELDVMKAELTRLDPPWARNRDKPKSVPAEEPDVQSNARPIEDDWSPFYAHGANGVVIIAPPAEPTTLERLAQENNALAPCIEAMVTNVDGTGYDIVSEDEDADDTADDETIARLSGFFDEVFPGVSMVELRRALRRDIETTGNGYIEVLRNAAGELVFLRHIEASRMRIVRLDTPVTVEKTVTRGGKEMTVSMLVQERRYAQLISGRPIYFREFGSTRHVNKETGAWVANDEEIDFTKRGTEIIHFRCVPDANTPYGIPRWFSQLPSVLGARKAEEHNLEYFNSGGIPPILILLMGGTAAEETKQEMSKVLSSKGAAFRAAIMEVYGTGGTIERETPVRVQVERFGGEQASDAMFQQYDLRCGEHIREAFRLPALFVGKEGTSNYATAYTAMTLAEGQVFRPARDAFDEVVTRRILPELEGTGYRFRSRALTLKDTQAILSALTIAAGTQAVEPEDVITEINAAVGTDLKYKEPPKPVPAPIGVDGKPAVANEHPMVDPKTGMEPKPPPALKRPKGQIAGVVKDADEPMLALALKVAVAARQSDYAEVVRLMQKTAAYDGNQRELFNRILALHNFTDPSRDLGGAGAISACTLAVLGRTAA